MTFAANEYKIDKDNCKICTSSWAGCVCFAEIWHQTRKTRRLFFLIGLLRGRYDIDKPICVTDRAEAARMRYIVPAPKDRGLVVFIFCRQLNIIRNNGFLELIPFIFLIYENDEKSNQGGVNSDGFMVGDCINRSHRGRMRRRCFFCGD